MATSKRLSIVVPESLYSDLRRASRLTGFPVATLVASRLCHKAAREKLSEFIEVQENPQKHHDRLLLVVTQENGLLEFLNEYGFATGDFR